MPKIYPNPNRKLHSYTVEEPESGWRAVNSFTPQEKMLLRPIAETLAMLNGNPFFPYDNHTWYEQYLPEAHALWESNGGTQGWAGTSNMGLMFTHENSVVEEAFNNWVMLKQLYKDQPHD